MNSGNELSCFLGFWQARRSTDNVKSEDVIYTNTDVHIIDTFKNVWFVKL